MKTIQLKPNVLILKFVLLAALTYIIMSLGSSTQTVYFSAPAADTTTVPSWIDELKNLKP